MSRVLEKEIVIILNHSTSPSDKKGSPRCQTVALGKGHLLGLAVALEHVSVVPKAIPSFSVSPGRFTELGIESYLQLCPITAKGYKADSVKACGVTSRGNQA